MLDLGTVMAADELDVLLQGRLGVSRADVIAALKILPARQTSAGSIGAEEARLLDAAGFVEDPESSARVAVSVIADMAWLVKTSYAACEVASKLGVNESRIEQWRRARSLWAIDDNGSWIYPAVQFDVVDNSGRDALTVVGGLDEVLRALPTDLHPLAIAGFLLTPKQELAIDGRARAVRDWLNNGGAVGPVLQLIDLTEWVRS